jgi:hypothetical protein
MRTTAVPTASTTGQRGAVTAELAMAVPLLLGITLGLVWLLTVAFAQLRMVDAVRETARAAARGEAAAPAIQRGQDVAPAGAVLQLTTDDEDVVASGSVTVDGVDGLLEALPSVTLTARAVTAREQPP